MGSPMLVISVQLWNNALISRLISHPEASEHRCWVAAPPWIHSVHGKSDRRSWRCDCHVRLWNRHKRITFENITFLPSRSIRRCQYRRKLDYYGVCFAHLAIKCGTNAKDPSGLDSDRQILHSRCCEDPSRPKAPRDSRATSQRDSRIWIQSFAVFSFLPSFFDYFPWAYLLTRCIWGNG